MPAGSPSARGAVCALVATSLSAWTTPGLAINKVACVEAAEAGQRLRKEGHLVSARDRLVVCASPECPEVVSQDCTGWLGQVQRSLASVVIKAYGDDEPLSDVAVFLDGAELTERAPTATIEVDPGDHVVRCEHAGFAPVEERTHLVEGERGREIACELASLVARAREEAPGETRAPAEVPGNGGPTRGGIPWIVWPVGGLGVAGVTAFAVLGLSGKSDESALARPMAMGGCAPYCTPSQVDPIRTKFVVADISLAVGIVALAAAGVIALLNLPSPSGRAGGAAGTTR
jgi:hypothetical protein